LFASLLRDRHQRQKSLREMQPGEEEGRQEEGVVSEASESFLKRPFANASAVFLWRAAFALQSHAEGLPAGGLPALW
jgi:hypothetical protein